MDQQKLAEQQERPSWSRGGEETDLCPDFCGSGVTKGPSIMVDHNPTSGRHPYRRTFREFRNTLCSRHLQADNSCHGVLAEAGQREPEQLIEPLGERLRRIGRPVGATP